MINNESVAQVVENFKVEGSYESAAPYGTGAVHETYLVTMRGGPQYILQKINQRLFRSPKK